MHWLAQLGVLCAGNMPAADAKVKIQAYGYDLEFPALCFTDATRASATRKFTWFPSFAELTEHLEAIARPYRIQLERMRRISSAETKAAPRGPKWSALTEAERKAHNEMMARLKSELASSEPIPKPLYPAI